MHNPLFPPSALAAFFVPGIAERWAAVQQQIHPQLLAFAEQLRSAAAGTLPRSWPLYELSFKSSRYVNRGRGQREPIDEYHFAIDRVPRGAGIYVGLSAAERAVLVGMQIWRIRKEDLRSLWEHNRALWSPLIERIPQARFADASGFAVQHPRRDAPGAWIERYLNSRGAAYLWFGFVFDWDQLPADLEQQMLAAVLLLLPLNEALMEQAEANSASARLRELPSNYALAAPPIETIIARIREAGFAYAETTIRAYHVALQTRPLVILPGISGTGKTRLTRLYADAVHGISTGQENPYYLIVAVQPDWHNARDLLGYYNALTGLYQPTLFLRFLLRAAADPQQPYFVCLDEMNLARPEYYLAPLLSALETAERSIDLGAPGDELRTSSGESFSNPLRLPMNIRLTGTVNVDESTHTLSDKLLDRVNLIELTEVDLEGFRAGRRQPVDPAVWAVLSRTQQICSQAGQPFGYRVLAEVLDYVEGARGILSPGQAFDLQLKQKVLPRLRGEDSPRLRTALAELLGLSLGLERGVTRSAQIGPAQLAQAPYPESATKLLRMLERLDNEGFTDFY